MDDDIRMRVKMELPFLVRVLASDAVEKAVEFMGKFGVKRREVRYIMALWGGPMTQKELCETLLLDKANTARAIAVLIENGLVRKDKRGVGRSYKVALTPKGMEVADTMNRFLDQNIDVMCADFPDDVMCNVLNTMETMCTNLDEDGSVANNIDLIKGMMSDRLEQGSGPDS